MKHTPAPWQISDARKGKTGTSLFIWRNDEGEYGNSETNTNYKMICQHVHNRADAELIATAPLLLLTLNKIINHWRRQNQFICPDMNRLILEAEAMIVKVEGK